MAIQLTDAEKLAPSERLAKNLEYYKNRLEDEVPYTGTEIACVGSSVAHAGFCVEQALLHLDIFLGQIKDKPEFTGYRLGLGLVKSYLNGTMQEVKDATFILDGWHAEMVSKQQVEEEGDDEHGCITLEIN